MTSTQSELLHWGRKIASYRIPRWKELPDIDLYMDQVVILIEKQLGVFLYKEGEHIITPAMVNNYVKLGIIPPPVKKRYSRTHLAYLIVICLLKEVLTISEIKDLICHQIRNCTLEQFFDHFCEEQERAFAIAANQAAQDPTVIHNEENRLVLENLALKMSVLANASITFAGKAIELQNKEYKNPEEEKDASEHPKHSAKNPPKQPTKHAPKSSSKKVGEKVADELINDL